MTGDNSRHRLIARLFDKWEELDGPNPIARSLGLDKFQEVVACGSLVGRSEYDILQRREDLSFWNE